MNVNGACSVQIETSSDCLFDWWTNMLGGVITITIRHPPNGTYLTLRGSEADRLFVALREAINDRDRRQLAVEPGSNTEVSSNA